MKITVLLADDHTFMREGLTHLLEINAQIKVIGTANHRREAVRQVLQLRPNMAMLDIRMADMNGVEAARQISECAPQVPYADSIHALHGAVCLPRVRSWRTQLHSERVRGSRGRPRGSGRGFQQALSSKRLSQITDGASHFSLATNVHQTGAFGNRVGSN